MFLCCVCLTTWTRKSASEHLTDMTFFTLHHDNSLLSVSACEHMCVCACEHMCDELCCAIRTWLLILNTAFYVIFTSLPCCHLTRSGQAQIISSTGLLQGDLLSFDCDSVDDNFEYDVSAPKPVQGKERTGVSTAAGTGARTVTGTEEIKKTLGFFDSLIIMSDSASSSPSESTNSNKNSNSDSNTNSNSVSKSSSDKEKDSESSEVSGPTTASESAPASTQTMTSLQPLNATSKPQPTTAAATTATVPRGTGIISSSSNAVKVKESQRSWFDWIAPSQ